VIKAEDGVDSRKYFGAVDVQPVLVRYPINIIKQFQYADDIAQTYQHDESFPDYKANLAVDLERLNQYFIQIQASCVFHLSTYHANRTLDIQFAATPFQHVEHPKYLGVTLDRSLTYKTHLSKTAKKVAARVNLVAETDWHKLQ
jgi:hypothetical protein